MLIARLRPRSAPWSLALPAMLARASPSRSPALHHLHAGPVGLVGRVGVADQVHRQREVVVLPEGREGAGGLAGQLGQRRAAVLGLTPGGLDEVVVLRIALGHVASVSRCTARRTSGVI